MDEKITMIGKIVRKHDEKASENKKWLRFGFTGYIVYPKFTEDGKYIGVDYEEADSTKYITTLQIYSDSGGRRTAPIVSIGAKNPFESKIIPWLKKAIKDINIENTKNIIESVLKTLSDSEIKAKILSDISQLVSNNFRKKDTIYLTIKIGDRFLGEIDGLMEYAYEERMGADKKDSGFGEGICYVCGNKGIVYAGFTNTKWDTDDKFAYIPGFDRKANWRNKPVCRKCREDHFFGKMFILNNFKFKFYGLDCILVPLPLVESEEVIEEIIDIIRKKETENESQKKKFVADISELFQLKDMKNRIPCDIIFVNAVRNMEKIVKFVRDIYPSRWGELFDAEDKASKFLKEYYKWKYPYRLAYLQDILEANYDEVAARKMFLDLVENIFYGNPISKRFFLHLGARPILLYRIYGKSPENLEFIDIKFLSSFVFLNHLNILKDKEVKSMVSIDLTKYKKQLGDYAQDINNPIDLTALYLGIAAGSIISLEKSIDDKSPLEDKIIRFSHLNKKKIEEIYKEVMERMVRYRNEQPWKAEKFDFLDWAILKNLSELMVMFESCDTFDSYSFFTLLLCGMSIGERYVWWGSDKNKKEETQNNIQEN